MMSQESCQQPQPAVVPAAAGLAYVCRYLEEICEVLRPDGCVDPAHRAPVVRRVLDAARMGADLGGPLNALHAALLHAGDPRGVWGAARALVPAGVDTGVPFEPVYVCPHGHCSGHSTAAAAAISFTCAVTRQPLRTEIL
jgi:hypothetical protein